MELIREVGAFAGLAAFFGLAVLALLYFSQARDVRRLRENAEFLVEGEAPLPDRESAEPVPAAVAAEEPAEAARAAAATAPTDAEAFRRAELARQAAERRQRFEQRRSSDGRGPGGIFSAEVPSTAVMIVGAVILLAGIGFGATRLLGGDDGSSAGGGDGGGKFACRPADTQVAVLNGTAEAGLAAGTASDLKQQGYRVTPITNTESAFDTSTIMFDQAGQDCASEIARVVGIQGDEQMNQEIRGISEGAVVAVVLGDDRATESSSTTEPSAEDETSTDSLVE
jgi:hypothetical protein